MGKIKQIMDKLEDDYELAKRERKYNYDMTPLNVNRDIIDVVNKGNSIFYIEGDTTEVEFWRKLCNTMVEDCDCNDDLQWDIGMFKFQKDLLEDGIIGKVKIALIGADDTDLQLVEYGNEALRDDYVPLYWCWCHDHYSITEHVKKALVECNKDLSPDLTDFAIRIPNC